MFYVASHDVTSTFVYLYEKLGDRGVRVVKELTKLHEQVIETRLAHPVDFDTHGEFVFIVDGNTAKEAVTLTAEEHVRRYMEMGLSKKDAVKTVAKERGVPRDEIYKAALHIEDETL